MARDLEGYPPGSPGGDTPESPRARSRLQEGTAPTGRANGSCRQRTRHSPPPRASSLTLFLTEPELHRAIQLLDRAIPHARADPNFGDATALRLGVLQARLERRLRRARRTNTSTHHR